MMTRSLLAPTLLLHTAPVSLSQQSPSLEETGVTGAGDMTLWPTEEDQDQNTVIGDSKRGIETVGAMLLLLVSIYL